jgi:hypothetical protein
MAHFNALRSLGDPWVNTHVRCHEFEVEVDSSFDGPTLRRLLRVVATC